MDNDRKSASMGVRGRLLLAFLGIFMFSVIAAGSGFFSVSQVGGELTRITDRRVPQALSWLEVSRMAESIVRAAPALLSVTAEHGRTKVSANIAAQARQLDALLQRNLTDLDASEEAAANEVANLIASLGDNLVGLDALVKRRLFIAATRDKLVRELVQADNVAARILTPGVRILDAKIVEWNRAVSETGELHPGEAASGKAGELAASIMPLIREQKGAALVEAVQNSLLRVAAADSPENVDLLVFSVRRSLDDLSAIAEGLPERIKGRMVKQVGIIEKLAFGANSLVQTRKNELAVIDNAEQLLAVNAKLSTSLTGQIDLLVSDAKAELASTREQAGALQSLNNKILIGVVAASLISSILIVWLYVGRNLIARLTGLSDSMLAIAGGNLHVPLPASDGGDEIARMAQALKVFRDTAVEVEESNLREIAVARRRLVDAIENSSDGFAFYDGEDRLVICNSKYRDLLDLGEAVVEAGMSFETIVRQAAQSGRISEARGHVEDWVRDRLAQHRMPGETRMQRYNEGRWLLISERRTGDGGTVAVYTDITELKQREEELAEKSRALEQLSNQLAKYLSPQIYASIFSGRQPVRIASQRKRLTIFFSDITAFTETTDRLQSEDLTRILNQYLTEMSEIALKYGATIDKYVGDAMLIFFGDPETRGVKEDAIACVKMAIAMRQRMLELQHVWMDSGIEKPLRCRIGINTGVCTVGNFGSETRMDYTIIGSAVNLASRLETACPPGEILISYETHAHVKGVVHCEEHGQIEVKGFSYPIATFRVIDLYENMASGKLPIHARSEHFQLDIEVAQLSPDEQRETAAVLMKAAERLLRKN